MLLARADEVTTQSRLRVSDPHKERSLRRLAAMIKVGDQTWVRSTSRHPSRTGAGSRSRSWGASRMSHRRLREIAYQRDLTARAPETRLSSN